MEMELRRSIVAQRHVLVVNGDIDLVSLPRFNDALARLVGEAKAATVVVDLDGTGVMEDAALGLLLGAAGKARGSGGDLVVVCTEPRMRARLEHTGFDRAVVVANNVSTS